MSSQLLPAPTYVDPNQQGELAAKEMPGPLLLLAGPGSGKTECLAMRLNWLVKDKGIKPDEITVITFTNEAARNMKERISNPQKLNVYIEPDSQPKRITTMHSLSLSILREKLDALGLKEGFSVVVEDDIRELLFQDAASLAGRPRAEGLDVLFAKQAGEICSLPTEGKLILQWYDKILRSMNSIDFDDQLILACKALEDDSELLKKYRDACKHLLVDEYQDINAYQDKLIKLLSKDSLSGLYVVGDDDQSIYRFRGGSPKYIRDFETVFAPSGRVIRLSVCRRCPSNIINAAIAIINKFNPGRLLKPNFDFVGSTPGRVIVHDVPSQNSEAQTISQLAAEAPVGSSTMILVPSAPFAKPIKRALEKRGLGYEAKTRVKLPGMRIIDTASRWLADYKDNLATRVLMNGMCQVSAFGVPTLKCTTPEKVALRESSLGRIAGLWLRTIGKQTSLYKALEAECRLIEKKASKDKTDTDILLVKIRDAFAELNNKHTQKSIDGFLDTLVEVLKPWGNPTGLLDEIKDALDEAYVRRGSKSPGIIRLLSMGLAKGLEADYVHVVGLDNGIFPKDRASTDEKEEASRLLYVAMSRAKAELHLYHSRTRGSNITFKEGSYQMTDSPFLSAVPANISEKAYIPPPSKKPRKP